MNTEEKIEVLQRTKEVLFEKGWLKGAYCNKQDNVCIYGAVRVAMGDTTMLWSGTSGKYVEVPEWSKVTDELDKFCPVHPATGLGHAPTFNDHPDTRFEDVIDLVDRAIIGLKEEL